MTATLYCGDVLAVLKALPDGTARCCVTSPPYWGLRDYGMPGQLGLERTPGEYVTRMVEAFREVRRVLADDGTLWLNIGDSYNANQGTGFDTNRDGGERKRIAATSRIKWGKPKDLVGIPWRLAFALQADGWWLRSDIIWAKPNPMPESVTDRPTKAHEYVFLLSKSERYYYDGDAIREESQDVLGTERFKGRAGISRPEYVARTQGWNGGGLKHTYRDYSNGRNARTVWDIATQPYPQAHFATFPEELARRCILAGSAPGDCVLDPFGGSGTVAQVATGNGRSSIYIDLNPKYVELARQRIGPMLCKDAA